MYDSYIMRRTQIYLDEGQDRRLAERAIAAGVSKSNLIRTAIDAFLQAEDDAAARLEGFRSAVRTVAGAAPDLEPGADYVRALRDNDRDHQQRLEARRRA
jgi:Ribbon-helix-helix protein, copG family